MVQQIGPKNFEQKRIVLQIFGGVFLAASAITSTGYCAGPTNPPGSVKQKTIFAKISPECRTQLVAAGLQNETAFLLTLYAYFAARSPEEIAEMSTETARQSVQAFLRRPGDETFFAHFADALGHVGGTFRAHALALQRRVILGAPRVPKTMGVAASAADVAHIPQAQKDETKRILKRYFDTEARSRALARNPDRTPDEETEFGVVEERAQRMLDDINAIGRFFLFRPTLNSKGNLEYYWTDFMPDMNSVPEEIAPFYVWRFQEVLREKLLVQENPEKAAEIGLPPLESLLGTESLIRKIVANAGFLIEGEEPTQIKFRPIPEFVKAKTEVEKRIKKVVKALNNLKLERQFNEFRYRATDGKTYAQIDREITEDQTVQRLKLEAIGRVMDIEIDEETGNTTSRKLRLTTVPKDPEKIDEESESAEGKAAFRIVHDGRAIPKNIDLDTAFVILRTIHQMHHLAPEHFADQFPSLEARLAEIDKKFSVSIHRRTGDVRTGAHYAEVGAFEGVPPHVAMQIFIIYDRLNPEGGANRRGETLSPQAQKLFELQIEVLERQYGLRLDWANDTLYNLAPNQYDPEWRITPELDVNVAVEALGYWHELDDELPNRDRRRYLKWRLANVANAQWVSINVRTGGIQFFEDGQ